MNIIFNIFIKGIIGMLVILSGIIAFSVLAGSLIFVIDGANIPYEIPLRIIVGIALLFLSGLSIVK